MTLRRTILAAAMAVLAAGPAAGQIVDRNPDLVDRVVAVVGDSAILLTQVQEEVERMRAQNAASVPTDPSGLERLYREVLDTWVNRLLVIQAAEKDSLVTVDEARVEEIVNQEISQRSRSFRGGQAEFQQALEREGITLAEYREILTTQVRQEQLQQTFVQRRLQSATPVEVSEDELRAAFGNAQDQLQDRPSYISFDQVVLAPQPSDSSKAAAQAKAQQLRDSIRGGADFEELAKAFSQDPGSAENGGDLGWFRRGAMVREFEDAAFALMDGQVSNVVETEFGFHIIKVERSRAGERKGRHILVRADVGPGDADRARLRADSVVELARAGTPMAELFTTYSDPEAPDSLTVTQEQVSQLPPGYEALRTAAEGQIIGPVEYETGRGETRLAVIRVREIREAGAYTFEDVKAQLAQQVQRTKQIQRMLDELRAKTHVEIRM